jgi:hypothetical protein
MQQEWNIKSRSDVCDVTGRSFTEGDGFDRIDLSEEAWNSRAVDAAAHPVFSSWRSRFEPPAPPPPEVLRRDDAEGMLRRLMDSNDPAHLKTRYLLAVMLERKRLLRPRPSPEKGTLVYEHAATGETFIITDPGLSLADLGTIQEEVTTLLTGLSLAPAPSATPSPREDQGGMGAAQTAADAA